MNKKKLRKLLTLFLICACTRCATSPRPSVEVEAEHQLFWPSPPDQPRIRFIKTVSTPHDMAINGSWWERGLTFLAGKKETYLRMPQQVSLGPSGRLYVTDQFDKCLHIFDQKKKRYTTIKEFGDQPIYSPGGIAEGRDGIIYLSDTLAKKVFVFDSRGKPLEEFGGPELFGRPTGMVYLATNGCLYVVDTSNHEVKVFNENGKFAFKFGGRGEQDGSFNFPTYISSDDKDRLYITDTLNHRIQVFDSSGKFLRAFGKLGDAYGSFSIPKGVGVDSEGDVYVVDSLHDAVQIFDQSGQLLLSFCTPGNGDGELWLPAGIAIDAQNRIYVADTCNGRIQIFQLLSEDSTT